MTWNWQLPQWPHFTYDPSRLSVYERDFLLKSGSSSAYIKAMSQQDSTYFVVEVLTLEGLKSSRIEGDILDRESLQSSIRNYFGLLAGKKESFHKEDGMAQLLCDVYKSFDEPLSHEMLLQWHKMLFKGSQHIRAGKYRTHPEAMHIVSEGMKGKKVHFEAPPSKNIPTL